MADIVIRGFEDTVKEALQAKAAAAGMSLEGWLREELKRMAKGPIVRASYKLTATSEDGASVRITRHGDGGNAVGGGGNNLSQLQYDAYKQAKLLVERNGEGDREKALALLSSVFDDVFETAI